MADDNFTLVLNSIRVTLAENDGEVPYWGELIPFNPSPKTVVQDPKTAEGNSASKELEKLRIEKIGNCQRCGLCKSRTNIVFGVGCAQARVMFVGEGPGFDEDQQGEPFVGKAGQLLDRILKSIGLDRSQVYIANVVKCHPMIDSSQAHRRGNDRPPSPAEIAECLPFLREQIRIIHPELIVTLGAVATRALLNTTEGITKLRGQVRCVDIVEGAPGFHVLATYHPAALLRNPDLKRDVWTDMKLCKQLLGL